MDVLRRSKFASDAEAMALYGNLAIKLLRTYSAQIEALAKLRRGPQVVEVRHVHVYPGGQAIVGEVHQHSDGGGGAVEQIGNQPYELAALTYAPGPAVRSAEPGGHSMPMPRDQGKETLPITRRRERKRRA
jgi:hypothetical protein